MPSKTAQPASSAIIEEALQQPGQDVSGICHDNSTMAKLAIRSATNAARKADDNRWWNMGKAMLLFLAGGRRNAAGWLLPLAARLFFR